MTFPEYIGCPFFSEFILETVILQLITGQSHEHYNTQNAFDEKEVELERQMNGELQELCLICFSRCIIPQQLGS